MSSLAISPLGQDDLSALTTAYPERSPVNRHVHRIEQQATGELVELVAWLDGSPAGWVIVRAPGSAEMTEQGRAAGCAELGDLYVAERFRGRGIGRALMEAAETWAAGNGFTAIGLAVTSENTHNDVARSMYQRSGYEDSGLGVFDDGYFYWDEAGERHWDGEPHRYLVKALDPSSGG
jgi:GNAT superfamily N-acetyltransferase